IGFFEVSLCVFFVIAAALNGQVWLPIKVLVLLVLGFVYCALMKNDRKGYDFVLIRRLLFVYVLLVAFVFIFRYMQYLSGRHFDNFIMDTLVRIFSYLPA